MATPRPENRPNTPEKRLRKKRKAPKKFRLSYSLLLLLIMPLVGAIAGIIAYGFGKQALEGVNPSPTGVKLPRVNPQSPSPKPQPPKPTSQSQGNQQATQNVSIWLDEASVIAEIQMRSQNELGALRRPNPTTTAAVNKSNQNRLNRFDRRAIFARVDRAYNSMRDPLAISANADERISAQIAALRQRVYSQSAMLDRSLEADLTNTASLSLEVQGRDTSVAKPLNALSQPNSPSENPSDRRNSGTNDSANSTNSFLMVEPIPSMPLELDR